MPLLLHTQSLAPRTGTLRADIPGAIAILCAIAFGTGITEEHVRQTMSDEILAFLAAAVIFGLLYFRLRKSLEHRLLILRDHGEITIRIEGPRLQEDFGPGFTWNHGISTERIDAYIYERNAQVTWVQFQSPNRRVVTIRRALGIQESRPRWPKQPAGPCSDNRFFSGQPVDLYEILSDFCPHQRPEVKPENHFQVPDWSNKTK